MNLPGQIVDRISGAVARRVYAPHIEVTRLAGVCRLGTEYGVAFVLAEPYLEGATIMSCGVGEDISFDLEFLHQFGGKVILVDPTPRAIEHYKAVAARFGRDAERPNSGTGCEPVQAYDLRGIDAGSLVLDAVALWFETGSVDFYSPPVETWVSHSITNALNGYRDDTPSIRVRSDTLAAIMARHDVEDLAYLKLDIEGAEIPVLEDMLARNIFPRQMHVAYDDAPSRRSRERIEAIDRRLRQSGYACAHREGQNLLYVRTG